MVKFDSMTQKTKRSYAMFQQTPNIPGEGYFRNSSVDQRKSVKFLLSLRLLIDVIILKTTLYCISVNSVQ